MTEQASRSATLRLCVLQRVQALLAIFGLAAFLYISLALSPYSHEAAKHLYVQHLVSHGPGRTEVSSTWHLSTTDAVHPAGALRRMRNVSWGPSQPQAWQVRFWQAKRVGQGWILGSHAIGCCDFFMSE